MGEAEASPTPTPGESDSRQCEGSTLSDDTDAGRPPYLRVLLEKRVILRLSCRRPAKSPSAIDQ